ncbi:MAG: nitrous oxide reductase family maturation protein NosD [Promethearchaeota archaeon]
MKYENSAEYCSHEAKRTTLVSYTPHSPITIISDIDFLNQGWSGNGTGGNPYLIEGLNITDSSTGISISDTRVYFEIRNCLVSSISPSGNPGIYLENVTHGIVDSCLIDSHDFGIELYRSYYCTLINNTAAKNQQYGYRFYLSENCTLFENRAYSNLNHGMYFVSSDNATLIGNIAFNNSFDGFHFEGAPHNCVLIGNEAIENGNNGIYFWYSYLAILRNNLAKGNHEQGFRLYNTISSELSHNTAIDNQHGFMLESADGSTLTNNTSVNNTSNGFHLLVTNDLFLNSNVARRNDQQGFFFSYSDNCRLVNNTAQDNRWAGFSFGYTDFNDLINNSALENRQSGYRISHSHFFNMTQNKAIDNKNVGFWFEDVSDTTVDNNLALGGSSESFYLVYTSSSNFTNNRAISSGFGISLDGSSDCRIEDNTVTDHNADGLFLMNSSNCTLVNNTVTGSIRYGVYLFSDSKDNLLYLNRFGGNDDSNAYDEGVSNDWDNGTHGNYWNDYSGTGVYEIPGSALSVDHHPFTFLYNPPELSHPSDIEYIIGSTGYMILWTVNGTHPAGYQILRNESVIRSGDWNVSSEIITISVDGLPAGTYVYRLEVHDTFDVLVSDTVLVTVLWSIPSTTTPGGPTSPTSGPDGSYFGDTITIMFGGLVAFFVIAVILFRRKAR